MKYPTKCTFCFAQLLNLKKYNRTKFYNKNNQIYIDIEDAWERLVINDLERYMQAAHDALQKLTELTEK